MVRAVKHGGFDEWMKARGKYGGQNKVPRMDNNGTMTKDMATWFESNGWLRDLTPNPFPEGKGELRHSPLPFREGAGGRSLAHTRTFRRLSSRLFSRRSTRRAH